VVAASTNNYKNNNKNKNKNNNNNYQKNNNKSTGSKKKHLPNAEWFSLSKAEQDKHSAKRKAEAIAREAASGSQTNRNLSVVQRNITQKRPHNDHDLWIDFSERPMA
jgi:hypothetical protein